MLCFWFLLLKFRFDLSPFFIVRKGDTSPPFFDALLELLFNSGVAIKIKDASQAAY
jgi:hypothetical protein